MSETDPILAWRCWFVDPTGLLRSYNYGIDKESNWPPGKRAEAACWWGTCQRPSPDENNSHNCGYYGWRDREPAYSEFVKAFPAWIYTHVTLQKAYGQVSMWGRIVEHAHGFRSKYAYPYSITLSKQGAYLAPLVRSRYLIDVDVEDAE